jgi:hypothetical protein
MKTKMKPTHSIEIKELLKFADRTFKSKKGRFLFQEGMVAEELIESLKKNSRISAAF